MVNPIANRFILISLVEDLTANTDSCQDTDALVVARAKAIRHLPSLSASLGAAWTSNEVVPFLLHCVRLDDMPVVVAIVDALPSLVAAFRPEAMAPVVVALASTSHRSVRDSRLVPAVASAFLLNSRAPASSLYAAEALHFFAQIAVELLQSAWPAGRAVGAALASSPVFHLSNAAVAVSHADERLTECRSRGDLVDDSLRRALHRLTDTVERSPAEAQLQWAAVASIAHAAANTAVRLAFCVAVSADLSASSCPQCEDFVAVLDAWPALRGVETAAAPRGVTAYFHRETGRVAALFGDVAELLSTMVLVSPVFTVVETGLAQTTVLIRALTSITAMLHGTPKRGAHHEAQQQPHELVIACIDTIKKVLITITSLSTAALDFRTRLSAVKALPSISVAVDGLRRTITAAFGVGSPLGHSVTGLFQALVTSGLRDLSQDPDGDVRSHAAAALAEICAQVSISPDGFGPLVPDLLGLCDQVRFDCSAIARESAAGAVANLCRGISSVHDARDRQALYAIMLDLLRDDAVNVRISASALLGDCIAIAGAHRVAQDLAAASVNLLSAPQWRARLSLASALGHLLQVFVTATATATTTPQTSSTNRALQFANEDDDENSASPLVGLITALIFDKAKAVRDAALASLQQCRNKLREGCIVPKLDLFAGHHHRYQRGGGGGSSVDVVATVNEAVDTLFTGVLWGAVESSTEPSRSYLMRVTKLYVAVAFGLPVEKTVLPLMEKMAGDAVANVRRAVPALLCSALKRSREDGLDAAGAPFAVAADTVSVEHFHISPELRSGRVLALLRHMLQEDKDDDVREAAASALAVCL